MNYADIKYFDVINGTGVRVSIFVSGCSHHCEHCFNQNTWNPNYGSAFTEEVENQVFEYIDKLDKTIKGISILGGDATFHSNIKPLGEFLKRFKSRFPSKNIWIWSGYTWESIKDNKDMFDMVSVCDVLVDGRFINDLKNLNLKFKGSSNQRVIDIKKSIELNKVIELY